MAIKPRSVISRRPEYAMYDSGPSFWRCMHVAMLQEHNYWASLLSQYVGSSGFYRAHFHMHAELELARVLYHAGRTKSRDKVNVLLIEQGCNVMV